MKNFMQTNQRSSQRAGRWVKRSRQGESCSGNNEGQALTEYLIIVMLVGIVSLVAVKSFGSLIKQKIQQVRKQVNSEVVHR